jgi:cyclomaltodextrinase
MNLSAVYHRCQDNMCYACSYDELAVCLRTGKDITAVYLHWDDPMNAEMFGQPWQWRGQRMAVPDCAQTRLHKYWTAVIAPPYRRCSYFFELQSGGEITYLFEDRFYRPDELILKGRKLQCFTFPWMNPSDINSVPAWVRDTCWYQIFPDRFCRSTQNTAALAGVKLSSWGGNPQTGREFYGGDLRGILDRLPYLAELGINGLYLTPIFKAGSSHRYDTLDYYEVDPSLGSLNDLKLLVAEAHRRGIRVMLDGVFNHCSVRLLQWQDVMKKGKESRYWDWFMINRWPFDKEDFWTYDRKYYSFHFTAFMPKLNTNCPELADYLASACEYWIRECDIDGFRLDVANELSHSFCKLLKNRLKAVKPDFFLLGEIWHDSMPWLRGDELDSVMDYPFRDAILQFFTVKGTAAQELAFDLNHCFLRYMKQNVTSLFHMLDSHDTMRLYTSLGDDENAYCQSMVLLYTLPGTPCIFYGSELPMSGGPDPDCRRCMPWEDIRSAGEGSVFTLLQDLIRLRRQLSALALGQLRFPRICGSASGLRDEAANSRVLYFERRTKSQCVSVCINAGNCPCRIPAAKDRRLLSKYCSGSQMFPGGFCICLH